VKGAHERVDLLEAKHECDFAHPEIRVREESSRRSLANVIENVLVRRAELAEATLHRACAHSEGLRNVRDGGTSPAHRLAESHAYVVDERASMTVLCYRQLQPGEENREELGVSIDHRERERGFVEDHEVTRRIEAELAAEVSAEHRLVRPAPGELDAPRPDWLHGSALRKAKDERKEQIGHQRRRVIFGEEPLEA
jgi:hypothetical protein